MATSSAVFDGCRQVVCAGLVRSQGGVYASPHRGPQLMRAVRRLSIFRDKRGRLREVLANIVNCVPPSQKIWFFTIQCRTCAMELSMGLGIDLQEHYASNQHALFCRIPRVSLRWTIGYLSRLFSH